MVVFGQTFMYLGKNSSVREKEVVFRQNWFFFLQSGCIDAKWCNREKVVVFG